MFKFLRRPPKPKVKEPEPEKKNDTICFVTFEFSEDGATEVKFHLRDPDNEEDVLAFAHLLTWIGTPNTFVQTLGVVADVLDEENLGHLKEVIFTHIVASDLLEAVVSLEPDSGTENGEEGDPCIKPSDVV